MKGYIERMDYIKRDKKIYEFKCNGFDANGDIIIESNPLYVLERPNDYQTSNRTICKHELDVVKADNYYTMISLNPSKQNYIAALILYHTKEIRMNVMNLGYIHKSKIPATEVDSVMYFIHELILKYQ